MQTGIITYNLNTRGRTYRGQDRRFNIKALARIINGPATQERVKNRDMAGYWGHFIRVKFGMIPPETVIINGIPQPLEPALLTTYLNCRPDGTVEHNAEFLDTGPGQLAATLYGNKTGGFSSAIDDEHNPRNFYGFDYVQEPNYTTNRGYPLDSVATEGLVLDSAGIAEFNDYNGHVRATLALLDSVNAEYRRALEALQQVSEENEQLLSLLATNGRTLALDDAGIMPVIIPSGVESHLERDMRTFHDLATLPHFVEPSNQKPENHLIARLLRRSR